MKKWFSIMLCVSLLVLVAGILFPEESAVTLEGVVMLADGSVIPGVTVTLTGKTIGVKTAITDEKGYYCFFNIPSGAYQIKFALAGFNTLERKGIILKAGKTKRLNEVLQPGAICEQIVVMGSVPSVDCRKSATAVNITAGAVNTGAFNTEEYSLINENQFKNAKDNPLSTFSIDVDTASYSNTRRFLKENALPPKDAVRIEELINYFTYDYPQPEGDHPFSVTTELSTCPWHKKHLLVHLGLQGRKFQSDQRGASNLVFLLDVSGSMEDPVKLPLLQSAFKLLVQQLDDRDRVAIVVYAGASGLVLPATAGNRTQTIIEAIDQLHAGGTTAGGAGIELAYKIATENFIKNGNNRVILATDGDFNVGISDTAQLVRVIEEKREKGIFLTVLGFGGGNLKDSRMEQLADKGNGNYYYIDNLLEAKKVLVDGIGGTLFTIAKDVKIQVEFNPAQVKAYKLVGYENRLLAKEDFNDDTKDAGEMGSGHSVTALYEIIPAHSKENVPDTDALKYQRTEIKPKANHSTEIMTVKLRYKEPKGETSKLFSVIVQDKVVLVAETSKNFRFASAVAQWGLLLRNSEHKGTASFNGVLALAKGAKGKDESGYRAEFIQLVELSKLLTKQEKESSE